MCTENFEKNYVLPTLKEFPDAVPPGTLCLIDIKHGTYTIIEGGIVRGHDQDAGVLVVQLLSQNDEQLEVLKIAFKKDELIQYGPCVALEFPDNGIKGSIIRLVITYLPK